MAIANENVGKVMGQMFAPAGLLVAFGLHEGCPVVEFRRGADNELLVSVPVNIETIASWLVEIAASKQKDAEFGWAIDMLREQLG